MAPNERELSSICDWLESTHHVRVDIEWLDACIAWVKEEQHEQRSTLRQQVYEQWLMSDLSESGAACLLGNITTCSKGNIPTAFALQMNSIVNIGASAYTQLKKVKGEDVTPSRENSTQPQYQQQQRPSRLLKMELTDGHNTVHAIEYKSISSLHPNLSPGIKVLVSGSPVFRRGIIFLTESNIKILGGEVDGLLEQNSQKNILFGLAMKNATAGQLAHHQVDRPPATDNPASNDDNENNEDHGAHQRRDAVANYDSGIENNKNIPNRNNVDEDVAEFFDDDDETALADVDLDMMEGQNIVQNVFRQRHNADNDDFLSTDEGFESGFLSGEQNNNGEEFFSDGDTIDQEFFEDQNMAEDFFNDGADDVLSGLMDGEF